MKKITKLAIILGLALSTVTTTFAAWSNKGELYKVKYESLQTNVDKFNYSVAPENEKCKIKFSTPKYEGFSDIAKKNKHKDASTIYKSKIDGNEYSLYRILHVDTAKANEAAYKKQDVMANKFNKICNDLLNIKGKNIEDTKEKITKYFITHHYEEYLFFNLYNMSDEFKVGSVPDLMVNAGRAKFEIRLSKDKKQIKEIWFRESAIYGQENDYIKTYRENLMNIILYTNWNEATATTNVTMKSIDASDWSDDKFGYETIKLDYNKTKLSTTVHSFKGDTIQPFGKGNFNASVIYRNDAIE